MDFDFNRQDSIRRKNKNTIFLNENVKRIIRKMTEVEEFLRDFSFFSLERNLILCGTNVFSLQNIMQSSELTVGSIVNCCEACCLADANTLLRKYRDDVFFYLYIVIYDTYDKLQVTEQAAKVKANIERWLNNNLDDLSIGEVLKTIGQSPRLKEAVKKYKLQSYFDSIGNRLNDYVHSNGVSFYNRSVDSYQGDGLQKQMQVLLKDMCFITISFIFLLTLCSPLSIMSTDYVDYLDCHMTPPENSEYWVAPFVTTFFKSNIDLIDESCMEYLKDSTLMEFE